MSKYNITENKQQRPAAYRTTVSPEVMDELQRKVIQKIVVEKCYRDKNYSGLAATPTGVKIARQLAQDLGTNTRYISAVVNNRFHKNYTELVNGYRVEEAMSLMVDRRYQKTNIEDISAMVGFSNRQSFYAAFYRFVGKTPRQYRVEELEKRAIDTTPKKRGRKPKNRQEGNA